MMFEEDFEEDVLSFFNKEFFLQQYAYLFTATFFFRKMCYSDDIREIDRSLNIFMKMGENEERIMNINKYSKVQNDKYGYNLFTNLKIRRLEIIIRLFEMYKKHPIHQMRISHLIIL